MTNNTDLPPSDSPPDPQALTFREELATHDAVIIHSVEQLAIYQNMRDHQESGTEPYHRLDTFAQDSYLKDAFATLMALIVLGWRHPGLPEKEIE